MSQENLKKIQEFVTKVDDMKKFDKVDLSVDQDLTIAIMNLIGIEEHLFFSGAKTEKTTYYDLITEVRNIRKDLLKKLIKEYEGEVWCISKHLLASSYRLMEVGTKLLDKDKKSEAYEFFTKSFELYSLFWGLNLNILTSQDVKTEHSHLPTQNILKNQTQDIKQINTDAHENKKPNIQTKLKNIVRKVIDCCIE